MSPVCTDLLTTLARPGSILLDTVRADAANHACLLFSDPVRVLVAPTQQTVRPVLAALDAAVAEGYYVAGYMAYEAGYAFETAFKDLAPNNEDGLPLAWFGVYHAPIIVEAADITRAFDEAEAQAYTVRNIHLTIDPATYFDKLTVVKRCIREGEVYQINFTDSVVFDVDGNPAMLYGQLRCRQRVPFGAYLHTGTGHILSLSPELFFQREGRRIWTQPMKGTLRRGRTFEEDRALQRALAADEKNRAENLMIVDLLRNDLSRCCVPGSVQTPSLFDTTVYETLIQMTSTIEGQLCDGVAYADVFEALFPCGSVTGAPKIRAMQIISGLEARPRGVYCGAIGYASPDDRAVFNVAIRTVVLRDRKGVLGTGSGIVWDSDPAAEYEECRLKTRFLVDAVMSSGRAEEPFELIETMRAEANTIRLLELHLDRLRASAAYFGFRLAEAAARKQIGSVLRTLSPGCHKVRLTLRRNGGLQITTASLPEPSSCYRRVLVAAKPIDSQDVFFYHKTTRRQFYEEAYRRAQEAGYDEILFVNERGEMTEGSRTNLFMQHGGRWYTPPITSGLLGGVYRRHLLQTLPGAEERVVLPDDITSASGVYLCNAVHGLRPVDVVQFEAMAETARRA